MDHEAFFARLRALGAGDRTIEAARRGLKSLEPPYPAEPEIVSAQEARARRRAEQPLRDFLARRGER